MWRERRRPGCRVQRALGVWREWYEALHRLVTCSTYVLFIKCPDDVGPFIETFSAERQATLARCGNLSNIDTDFPVLLCAAKIPISARDAPDASTCLPGTALLGGPITTVRALSLRFSLRYQWFLNSGNEACLS